jgi:hypothetical protein
VAVVVLLLIAVALATSYSAMRTQTVNLNVRQNAGLGVSARRAALTGLTAGLREMHSPDWTGTGTAFARALGPSESFKVEFIAGDTSLTAADPDYEESPYRVTLSVLGIASDPSDARRVSTHTIRAVVRLIPRAMPSEPSDWSRMQRYTLFQTKITDTTFDIPCRVEGDVRLQGKLCLGRHYPDDEDAWENYFYHQNTMRNYGFDDARVFTGRVYLPYLAQESRVRNALEALMSVPTTYRDADEVNSDWAKPENFSSYRVYQGGPVYAIPRVVGPLANEQLVASPVDNPLGLFYSGGNLTIDDNVTIRGTLFCRDDIAIDGIGVRFASVDIPPLSGSSLPIRLPVATCRDFKVRPGSSCKVDGLLAVFDDVEVQRGSPRGRLHARGRIITRDFEVFEDDAWKAVNWRDELWNCYQSYHDGGFPWPLFTLWMEMQGYPWKPTVHVKQGEDVQYHWHWPGDSIFVPHVDDFSESDHTRTPGLRWELIEVVHEDH